MGSLLLREGSQNVTLVLGLHTKRLVGAPRFELGTPCTPCKCATRLRHAPIDFLVSKLQTRGRGSSARDGRSYADSRVTARQLQRRRILIRSSSSTRICLTICGLWETSVRASSPVSLLRAPPMV